MQKKRVGGSVDAALPLPFPTHAEGAGTVELLGSQIAGRLMTRSLLNRVKTTFFPRVGKTSEPFCTSWYTTKAKKTRLPGARALILHQRERPRPQGRNHSGIIATLG